MKKLLLLLVISSTFFACNDSADAGNTAADTLDGVRPLDTSGVQRDTSSSVRIDSTLEK